MRTLFQPIKIGTMELKNRLVMAPMVTNYASSEGYVTERLKDYYVERAKGGVGLIIVEATCIDAPVGKHRPNMLCIDADKFIPGLRELAQAVKRHGAKIAIQLEHTGSMARFTLTGVRPVSASSIPLFPGRETARELTTEEVEEIIEKFGEGARRAKEAGFDAVEVLTGYYYLLGQFLSPVRNFRKDKYGGSFEGRLRLTLEVLERIREKVGDSYPISCKFCAPVEGIESEEEMDEIARRIEVAGANLIHRLGKQPVIQMNGYSPLSGALPMRVPRGYCVDLAERTKQVVGIPVMAVGRINCPDLAERILQEGKADLIGLGRALLADPEFPRKALEEKVDDIRPCIACCRGCVSRVKGSDVRIKDSDIICTVNPALGRETELRLMPAAKRKSVLVVGGGPAGMEAARVAALRGHKVRLYERKGELGGQVLLAATPPGKSELKGLTNYLKKQVEKLGVEVNLGEEVTASMVGNMKPDAIILATGGRPLIPSIPGIRGTKVVTAFDVLEGKVRTRGDVAIVGGGVTGCETAEYLAQQHKKVTIIEMLKEVAADEAPLARFYLLQSLKERGVRMLTETEVVEITEEGLTICVPSGGKETIKADTVVLATGLEPNKELERELGEKGFAVYSVGDCVEPRKIMEAMHEGYIIALKL